MSREITPPQVFLERRSYRRRRMLDALRLLPLVGVGLFLMPMLWPAAPSEVGEPVSMSAAVLYVFFAWLALIVSGALLWLGLREPLDAAE
ncbi:MAG: hypothetical protein AAGM84_01465 [Pseudomonadota bacterium]